MLFCLLLSWPISFQFLLQLCWIFSPLILLIFVLDNLLAILYVRLFSTPFTIPFISWLLIYYIFSSRFSSGFFNTPVLVLHIYLSAIWFAILLAIPLAFLVTTLLSIKFAILCCTHVGNLLGSLYAILLPILYTITVEMLFIEITQAMAQEVTHRFRRTHF